ncbi:MAG: lysylphosphatidylglycerol synthase transmembrane domain-containing protein, partial [Polyangiales bacterium]
GAAPLQNRAVTPPATTPARRRWRAWLLRLSLTGIALTWALRQTSWNALQQHWRLLPAGVWLLAALTYASGLGLGALRWQLLLRAYGAQTVPRWPWLWRAYWVAFFYNTFLPANVGGDVLRGYVTRRAWPSTGAAFWVVLIERLLGLAGLVTLASLALPSAGLGLGLWPGVGALVALGGVACGLWLPALLQRHAVRLPGRLPVLVRHIPPLTSPGALAWAALLSISTHLVVALSGHWLLSALHPALPLGAALTFIPIATATAYLPTIAGLGTREAALLALLGRVGVPAAITLSGALALFGVQAGVAALGGLLHLSQPLTPAGSPKGDRAPGVHA